jgi:hypothetical protein
VPCLGDLLLVLFGAKLDGWLLDNKRMGTAESGKRLNVVAALLPVVVRKAVAGELVAVDPNT